MLIMIEIKLQILILSYKAPVSRWHVDKMWTYYIYNIFKMPRIETIFIILKQTSIRYAFLSYHDQALDKKPNKCFLKGKSDYKYACFYFM